MCQINKEEDGSYFYVVFFFTAKEKHLIVQAVLKLMGAKHFHIVTYHKQFES